MCFSFSLQHPSDPESLYAWSMRQWFHPSSSLSSLLRLSWQIPNPVCLSIICIVATWTWKPWRNTAERGSDKAPLDAHENGAASIKRFLRTCRSFGRAYPSLETPFISVPPLSTYPSSHSHFSLYLFLFFHPEVLVLSAGIGPPAPHQQPGLTCFRKIQAHKTAWECGSMELRPSPDKIQGAVTIMKFFSRNCCLFGAAVQWLFFQ